MNNVTLEIESGEIYGLLGSNGAGKSTLSRLILGLEKQNSGRIRVFGKEKLGENKVKIGIVPQEIAFYTDFSVEKNIMHLITADFQNLDIFLSESAELTEFLDLTIFVSNEGAKFCFSNTLFFDR